MSLFHKAKINAENIKSSFFLNNLPICVKKALDHRAFSRTFVHFDNQNIMLGGSNSDHHNTPEKK